MSVKVPEGHICEAPDCDNPAPRGATCSGRCRTKKWKAENGYVDRRRPRSSSTSTSRRYAIVSIDRVRLEVLAYGSASSKARAERSFGISGRADLAAIAASRIPAAA